MLRYVMLSFVPLFIADFIRFVFLIQHFNFLTKSCLIFCFLIFYMFVKKIYIYVYMHVQVYSSAYYHIIYHCKPITYNAHKHTHIHKSLFIFVTISCAWKSRLTALTIRNNVKERTANKLTKKKEISLKIS